MTRALLIALLLLVPACSINVGSWGGHSQMTINGRSVNERDGELYVDDVHLPHSRWEAVTLEPAGGDALRISVATGDAELTGEGGGTARLEALLYSEIEGDGVVVLEDNRLQAVTEGEGKLLINAVRGSVPASQRLVATSGTGDLTVSGMRADLEVSSGTGNVIVRDGRMGELELHSATGMIEVEDFEVEHFDISGGTSDKTLRSVRAESGDLNSGTGDFELVDCSLEDLVIDTGTGDTVMEECTVTGRLKATSGTGDLSIRGGHYKLVETSFGTGDLRLASVPVIEELR